MCGAYDEHDEIETSDLDDACGDQENSHYCPTCDKEIKDKDLIPEHKRERKKK